MMEKMEDPAVDSISSRIASFVDRSCESTTTPSGITKEVESTWYLRNDTGTLRMSMTGSLCSNGTALDSILRS